MNKKQQKSYRDIFKATGLFGGVQVLTILITMVRTKFIAILIGTAGVGILGLLSSPLLVIASLTGLGISYSAVRDISESVGTGDEKRLARTIVSFRRFVIFTGIFGMLVTIVMSPWLSKWTFGDHSYTWAFVWLSVTLLLNAISGGQRALLQGMRKLQSMAKATVIGSFIGLLTSIPLYYTYGTHGIVPSIIITAIVALLLSWYFAKQVSVTKVSVSFNESLSIGKGFIKLGVFMSISAQIGKLVSLFIIAFISRTGGIEQTGLYIAGISFMGTYVGLIFTAMGTDYYPKLAAVNKDNKKVRTMVNQQAIISVLIMLPIVLVVLVSMPIVTKIFLTEKFVDIIPFVNLTALGVMLQAVSYSVGYISFAKGDSIFFFWIEGIFSNILNLILSVVGYWLFGLIGIGLAYILKYIIYLVTIFIMTHKRYEFSFDKELYYILSISIILSLLAYISILYLPAHIRYFVLVIIISFGMIYSFIELDKRLDIKDIMKVYFNKKL